KDQAVLELETDKATIEVPSSVQGVVTDVKVKVGDKVKVGQVILSVDGAAQKAAPAAAAAEPPTAPQAAAAPQPRETAESRDTRDEREPSPPRPVRAADKVVDISR